MKCLSLWQPHAVAIGLRLKPWETRDWSTGYRGLLGIHASLRRWTDVGPWHDEARRRLDAYVRQHGPVPMHYGAVIATARLSDCVRTNLLRGRIPPDDEFWGDFSEGERGLGRYAFALTEVEMLAEPVITRGFQGFFEVELPGASRGAANAAQASLFGAESGE